MDFEIGFIHDAMLASTTTTPTSSSSATAPTQTLEEAWDLPRCDVPGWEIKWMLLKTIRENNRINVQVYGTYERINPLIYQANFDEHEISLLIESDMMGLHFPGRLSYGYRAVEVRSVLNAVQCVAEADFGGNLSSVFMPVSDITNCPTESIRFFYEIVYTI